jgi:hypothetical protein
MRFLVASGWLDDQEIALRGTSTALSQCQWPCECLVMKLSGGVSEERFRAKSEEESHKEQPLSDRTAPCVWREI